MEELKTVTLRAGDWKAQIAPRMGMNAVSLTYREQPVLRSPESWSALQQDSCVYGTPTLMPPQPDSGRNLSV